MPRLRQVPRAEADREIVIPMYDRLFGDRDPVAEPGTATGTTGDWWTVYALVPDVMRHASLGFALYQSPTRFLPADLRELGQMRAGWLSGSQFVYSQHCKSCRALGIPDAKIEAISDWQTSDLFSPVERAVMAYADALASDHGRVGDGTFRTLQGFLSDEQILELTYITAMYEMHANICRALRLEFDDVTERVVEVAAPENSQARDIGADIAAPSE